MGEIKPQKTDNLAIISLFGTHTRDRTGMEVNPLVFETSASTDSAIWALRIRVCFSIADAKVQLFSIPPNFFRLFLQKKYL